MSALFDDKDKQHLYGVFQPNEHEYRVMYSAGKQKEWAVWSVYIKRDAIINRMNERFFGEWSSGFLDPQNPCVYHKDHVDCAMHFTIRGVRMEYNGSQSGTGENGAKGAATDAFKRVASQWGIGLYLQHAPEIFTKHPDKAANKQEKRQIEAEVQNKITQWVAGLLAEQNKVIEISQPTHAEQSVDIDDEPEPEPTPQPKDLFTDEILIVGVKQKGNNRYIVADGCTFFSRDIFRALDYDNEIIEELGKVGMRHLPDPIRVAYVEKTDDKGDTHREPVRVMRKSTGQVIDMNEMKETA